MVTVINPPPRKTQTASTPNGNGHHLKTNPPRGAGGGGSSGGGGANRGGGGNDEQDDYRQHMVRARYRVGMIVLLVTILMMFASLTIAYILLSGRPNWQPVELPARQLWASTTFIVLSSVAFEFARRAWRRGSIRTSRRWFLATGTLGACFVFSQILAWRELAAQGVYLEKNPYRAFFFLLTGTHALHLVGGIAALGYLVWSVQRRITASPTQRHAALDAGALYWHFVDGLWVYVFVLLYLWR